MIHFILSYVVGFYATFQFLESASSEATTKAQSNELYERKRVWFWQARGYYSAGWGSISWGPTANPLTWPAYFHDLTRPEMSRVVPGREAEWRAQGKGASA